MKHFTPATVPALRCNRSGEMFVRWTARKLWTESLAAPKIWIRHDDLHFTNVSNGIAEQLTWQMMDRHLDENSVFLDIGANVGVISLYASRVCRSEVVAIEPHPETAEILECNLADFAVTDYSIHRIAVSDQNGVSPLSSRWHNSRLDNRQKKADEVSVDTCRLDDLDLPVQPTFIKIDVEGHEEKVIHGGLDALTRWGLPPVLIEIHVNVNFQAIEKTMESIGYSIEVRARKWTPIFATPRIER